MHKLHFFKGGGVAFFLFRLLWGNQIRVSRPFGILSKGYMIIIFEIKYIILLFFHPIFWLNLIFKLYQITIVTYNAIRWSDICGYLCFICCSQLVYQRMVVKNTFFNHTVYSYLLSVKENSQLNNRIYRGGNYIVFIDVCYFVFNFDQIQYYVLVLYHLPRFSSFFNLGLCSSFSITSSGLKIVKTSIH